MSPGSVGTVVSKLDEETFTVRSRRRPPLIDAIVVAEAYRRRLLGVAGRLFGPNDIPPSLFGRTSDGRPLEGQHQHAHFLLRATDSAEIDGLTVWCPGGIGADAHNAIRATTLPALLGAPIFLEASAGATIRGPSRRWRSHTPFLPPRHPRRRGGRLVPTIEAQVTAELALRGHPAPIAVRSVCGPWTAFRTTRRDKPGSARGLGAHGFELEFEQAIEGPLSLGRNSHFGMGLFLPSD